MLWTIFVLLMIMWLLGMATSYTLGGFLHILLLLAISLSHRHRLGLPLPVKTSWAYGS
jgi:hypothetical protein